MSVISAPDGVAVRNRVGNARLSLSFGSLAQLVCLTYVRQLHHFKKKFPHKKREE